MRSGFDLVVVGMGSAGMTAAEFASSLGLSVAVVERARVGGDCLWTGCVPSKALLASAKAAHTMRHADAYGIRAVEPEIDLAAVWRRVRAVQRSIADTDDDPQRYREMGVELVEGVATLAGTGEVRVERTGGGTTSLSARFVLLCTGSRPAEPDVAGLAAAGFLTSEDLFELEAPPRSVVVIGGGPIAIEMAQAFARLGIGTTVLQQGSRILPRDEPELTAILAERLRAEGVRLHLGARAVAVRREGGEKVVTFEHGEDAARGEVRAEELLVAAGRRPNVDGLGLEQLGIEVTPRGVAVDDRSRTAVRSVYAVGDVAGRHLFTHAAGHEAVRAVRDMFFPGKGTVEELVPWCTFTDPELAHVGLTTAEAEERHGTDTDVWRIDLVHNDRARADAATDGAIVVVTAKGRIVGAHVLAPAAGELVHELALAIREGLKLGDLAGLVHVYPTLATSVGALAAESAFEKAQRYRWLVRRR